MHATYTAHHKNSNLPLVKRRRKIKYYIFFVSIIIMYKNNIYSSVLFRPALKASDPALAAPFKCSNLFCTDSLYSLASVIIVSA